MVRYSLIFALLFSFQYLSAQVGVVSGLTNIHNVNTTQGKQSVRGKITVKNFNEKKVSLVDLYTLESTQNCRSNISFSELQHPHSLSPYLNIEVEQKRVDPNTLEPIFYNINIPEHLPDGTYWSMIMVEGKDPIKTEELKEGISVGTKIR